MKQKILVSAVFAGALGLAAFAAFAANADKKRMPPQMVRVAIVRDAREINLKVDGPYHFRDADHGKVIGKGPRLPISRVRLLDKGIFIGMQVYPYQRIIIEPLRDASVVVNNRRFRGHVTVIRTADNRLTAVNSINIEDYIRGVLYHEVSHHWPMEAIKAQAVATRTYVLYAMAGSTNKDYDVTNDIYSQVYGGKDSERYRTGLAVTHTVGEVLAFKGKILPAYFHATCGGMTEDAKNLWGIDLAPLGGVVCNFCQGSPHMKWKKNFRLKDIRDALDRHGYAVGAIRDLNIVDRNRSERINNIKITSRDGKNLTISGKDFREAVGPNVLKSNDYEISMQGYYVDLTGKGWGHGVGLCQWGARGMALQQFTYQQILSYYYPRAEITDYHNLPVN
ncbi:MAG: SpoIID/LytB domain-containing protein [Candidatus Omnitrophica bacterium]|nr:SpoIID/LytB domain-containing protein [Candidatus Omnitrophota bacterium]